MVSSAFIGELEKRRGSVGSTSARCKFESRLWHPREVSATEWRGASANVYGCKNVYVYCMYERKTIEVKKSGIGHQTFKKNYPGSTLSASGRSNLHPPPPFLTALKIKQIKAAFCMYDNSFILQV